MSNLLQEALLDISQVKEVAEKNAKNVVLESLMPKIKDFIEEKLIEDDPLVENRKPADPEGGKGILLGDDDDELSEDEDEAEVQVQINVDERADSPFDSKVKSVDLEDEALALKEKSEKITGNSQDDDIININLDQIGGKDNMSDLYRLLENEGGLQGGSVEEEVYEEGDPEMPPEGVGEAEPVPTAEGGGVSEAELDEMLAELEAEDLGEVEHDDTGLDEWVEIDENELAEALRELEEGADSPFDTKVKSVDLDGVALALKEENQSLKSKLYEMKTVLSNLSKQLQESNLFNAKLLYANRLLNNKNLTKEEKVNIIETLDEAHTLREVKLVYNTFIKTSKKANAKAYVNESAIRRSLPGASSRIASSGASTQTLNESADLTRWKKLAGLA